MDGLIEQLRRREPGAAEELHRAYYGRIRRFVQRLIGETEADDVTQEVFLRVYRGIDAYQERERFEAWLFTIAGNLCFDAHRRRRPRAELADVAGGEDPAARTERREIEEELRAALRGLPFEQRQMFLLREDGGLTFREIAQKLGIPLGTALARMKYAVDAIKKRLKIDDL